VKSSVTGTTTPADASKQNDDTQTLNAKEKEILRMVPSGKSDF